jgi:hypothetical protein
MSPRESESAAASAGVLEPASDSPFAVQATELPLLVPA